MIGAFGFSYKVTTFYLAIALWGLSGCAPSLHWFKSDSWFSQNFQNSDAPDYIPLSAIPDKDSLRLLTEEERDAHIRSLRQKMSRETP